MATEPELVMRLPSLPSVCLAASFRARGLALPFMLCTWFIHAFTCAYKYAHTHALSLSLSMLHITHLHILTRKLHKYPSQPLPSAPRPRWTSGQRRRIRTRDRISEFAVAGSNPQKGAKNAPSDCNIARG